MERTEKYEKFAGNFHQNGMFYIITADLPFYRFHDVGFFGNPREPKGDFDYEKLQCRD